MKRVLRVGVYRGGLLVDDRYVPEKSDVTVGSSAKNMFALLGSNLPKERLLFKAGKQPVLRFGEGMTGELALDGQTRETLESLKVKARREGDEWALEVPDTARGWVAIDDATFFFQMVNRPPPPPKTQLPQEARVGLLSGLEMAFVGILALVLSVEGVAIFAIHQRPDVAADAPASAESLERFAEIIMPEKPKNEPPKEDDAAKKRAEEEARKKAEEEAKKQAVDEKKDKKEDKGPEAPPKSEQERKAAVREAVSKKGLLNVIGSAGGSGALANVFASGGGFSDDIAGALAGAGGVQVATGDDAATRRSGSGPDTVGIGGIDGSLMGGGERANLAEKKRTVAPQITFDDSGFEAETSSVDKDSLGRYIRMRIKSVQACYEKELKRNPSLKGKIVVRFVILTTGRVSEVSIDQNTMGDQAVASCIVNTVRRWSFPIKPEDDAPVSFPFVFSPGG